MKAYASIFFIFISFAVYSQEIVPKERFGEVELGITYEDVIWILGFDGSKVTKESAPKMLTAPVNEIGIDFDYIVNFQVIHNYRNTLIQKLINNGYNVYDDLNAELSVEDNTNMKTNVKTKTTQKSKRS